MALGRPKALFYLRRILKRRINSSKFYRILWKIDVFVKGAHRKIILFCRRFCHLQKPSTSEILEKKAYLFSIAKKEVQPFRNIQQDIFINAYGTYILNLVDAKN